MDYVDFVAFTGSATAGKAVAYQASRRQTPIALEIGGKDSTIVLSDADVERAAIAATYHSMQHGGQGCTALERAYVERPLYDRFVELVSTEDSSYLCGCHQWTGSPMFPY